MPDRQSSSGEVTTRPEPVTRTAAADTRGSDATTEANGAAASGGPAVPSSPTALTSPTAPNLPARPEPPAVEPPSATVAAEPEAVHSAPAQPVSDGGAVGDATVETVAHPADGRRGAVSSPTMREDSDTAEVPAAPSPGPRQAEEPPDAPPTVAVPTSAEEEPPTVAVRRPAETSTPLFPSPDATATQVLPSRPAVPAESPTERIRLPLPAADPAPAVPGVERVPPPVGPPPAAPAPEPAPPRRARRRLLVVAGVVAALGVAYGADLLFSSGSVPRGTTVAGVSVGGLSLADAEQTLRTQIEPRTTRPVSVTAGEARSELDPRVAGLAVDWSATLDRAGAQPLNPITRITSFFDSREVGVATSTDRAALDAALAQMAPIVNKAPVEGTVKFDGVTPVAVDPVPGQELNASAAADVLERDWANGGSIALPLNTLPALTTPDDVATAIAKVATPAVSAPVTVLGENGAEGTITPAVIASALSFRADQTGLVPAINTGAVTDALKPQLAASEKPGRDAKLDFGSGVPVIVPSQDGRGIDYPATLKDLLPVLTGTDKREITAVYADQPAKLTTDQLKALSINGVIGEFQTGGFAADSGLNIKRAAEQVNGTIVQPGETFSLNALTNPRDAAHGYVEAGIIENGHSARGVGGGVSQVATTLYNAAYFAGMTNVEHKEHSFYISRYPAGREATVFDNIIDLKFRNDNPTAIMIQTTWTPSSLNVKIFGSKIWEVTSASGPRTSPTEPTPITIPAGEQCTPSKGAPGFTITNTRTLKNVQTGAVRTDPTRTVKYNPSPIVICGG
jgi:vancomycin resistance protein YoaR